MTGVLLVNMGSPSSRGEMKYFLKKMFQDPAILPYSKMLRHFLAFIISNTRYKKSWKKYEMIGGSPLKESMKIINESLAKELGDDYFVFSAYSYSVPTIEDGLKNFNEQGIKNIIIISLYPQTSYTTTGSVIRDIQISQKKFKESEIKIIDKFYDSESFIKYWVTLINETIQNNNLNKPLLLFSAHAIPEYLIAKGETYVEEINKSASLISQSIGLDYKVSFQSKMKRMKWVGPDTMEVLKDLSLKYLKEIVVVPISFVNENLETLFDLDTEIIPYGKNKLNITKLCRTMIPKSHPLLIETLKKLIIKN